MQMGQRGATMNIGQLDGQPLALQIFNGMTAESTCVNERWAKDQLFRCVCFAGGRHQTILDETVGPIFQSTSSVWRTTRTLVIDTADWAISIHVLRAEDDLQKYLELGGKTYFNPRPPCGGRRTPERATPKPAYFNPRPPCGGRLLDMRRRGRRNAIPIHVLRAEDDRKRRTYP